MDIRQIHNALITIWPGGIPREGLVYLAGMIKAIVDKAGEGVGIASTAQTELEQALATAYSGPDAVIKIGEQIHAVQHKTVPQTPIIHASSREMRERIYDYVSKNPGATGRKISSTLKVPPWAIGYHLRRLKNDGRLIRSADLVPTWRTPESVHAAQSAVPVPVPVPVMKGRAVSAKILDKIKDYLAPPWTRRTQSEIAAFLKLGPWTVKRAVWQLQKEGAITRTKAVQGPHLYQIAK